MPLPRSRPRRALALVAAATLLLSPLLGAAGPIATFSAAGDADDTSWWLHRFEVAEAGTLTLTLDWDDPAADANVFLRAPGEERAVAFDRSDAGPKVLVHEATRGGVWRVGVKLAEGSTTWRLRVEHDPSAPG